MELLVLDLQFVALILQSDRGLLLLLLQSPMQLLLLPHQLLDTVLQLLHLTHAQLHSHPVLFMLDLWSDQDVLYSPADLVLSLLMVPLEDSHFLGVAQLLLVNSEEFRAKKLRLQLQRKQ